MPDKELHLDWWEKRLAKAIQARERAMERAAQAHNSLSDAEEYVCYLKNKINSLKAKS